MTLPQDSGHTALTEDDLIYAGWHEIWYGDDVVVWAHPNHTNLPNLSFENASRIQNGINQLLSKDGKHWREALMEQEISEALAPSPASKEGE